MSTARSYSVESDDVPTEKELDSNYARISRFTRELDGIKKTNRRQQIYEY